MQGRATRLIGGAACPSDRRRDRQRAAAREHVFVVLPLPVAVAGGDGLERALREDVGAGRDLEGRVRVVGGVGDVVKRPACFSLPKYCPRSWLLSAVKSRICVCRKSIVLMAPVQP